MPELDNTTLQIKVIDLGEKVSDLESKIIDLEIEKIEAYIIIRNLESGLKPEAI